MVRKVFVKRGEKRREIIEDQGRREKHGQD